MSQNPSVEEVMQSIRARVAERDAARNVQATSGVRRKPPEPGRSAGGQTSGAAHLGIQTNDLGLLHGEVETALEGTRLVGQLNPRNPGLHNDAIQLAKKVMRRSLTWYTRPLHHFQGGAIRALQRIEDILRSHDQSLQIVSQELDRQAAQIQQCEVQSSAQRTDLSSDIATLNEKMAALQAHTVSHTQGLEDLGTNLSNLQMSVMDLTERAAGLDRRLSQTDAELQTKLDRANSTEIAKLRSDLMQVQANLRDVQVQNRLRDRDIRRFARATQSSGAVGVDQQQAVPISPMFPAEIKHESDFDYFAFEDLYRGDEAEIRRRQKGYLEYFRGRDNVLDVGCGRGEFLELLRDNGIDARGVEAGRDQWLLCREKGLEVVQQDLFSYLESLPDGVLGGLFSAQVIEHFTAGDQLRFVSLAYRKTKQGSPVVVETINAQCVWAVMRNFFLDPTHVRPMHPETLKFAMNSAQFKNVELRFSSPMSDRLIPPLHLDSDVAEFNRRIQDLNELMYGSQDYAAIGWR
jgi:SAM-dependent methyltransferase